MSKTSKSSTNINTDTTAREQMAAASYKTFRDSRDK